MSAERVGSAEGADAGDPRLPGLAVLLDDDATTWWLRGHGVPGRARVRYLRHKPGTSVQAWVEIVRPDGGTEHAIAQATAPDDAAKLRKLVRSAQARGTWAVAAGSVVVAGHAADRPLPALAPVLAAGGTTLRHNPGRRWVGRSADGDLVKVGRPGREAVAVAAAHALAEHGVATPPVLEHGGGLLRLGWWSGRTLEHELTAALDGGALAGDRLAAVGALVASLHAVRPVGDDDGGVASHGDLSPDQVLVRDDGRLALLDLDRFTTAPPEADLGSFLGDLLARACSRWVEHGAADPLDEVARRAWGVLAPVLVGYREAGGTVLDEAVIDAGVASLRSRADEPWRRREPRAAHAVAARHRLVRTAADVLGRHPAARATAAPSLRHPPEAPRPQGWTDAVVLAGVRHEVLRGWPRPDGVVLLELGAADEVRRGAELHPDEASARARAARSPGAEIVATGTPGGGRLLMHPMGSDARLPALADRLARGERIVVHRPGRRAVLRGPGAADPYVKVTRRGRASDAVARHRVLAAHLAGTARAAEIREAGGDAVVLAPLPGASLLRLGGDAGVPVGTLAAAWGGVGRMLRALRRAPTTGAVAGLPVHDAEAERRTALAWVGPALERGLLPAVDRPEVEEALAELTQGTPAAEGLLHRDLHDQQVLVADDGALGLLDLDTAARGESVLDLANLLAHLGLRERQGLLTPERREAAEAALLDALDPDEVELARTAAYVRSARLRLAGVYALRPRWRGVAEDLLREALR
ncbi:hypothetical protein C8046_13555 [Serinibacter arcticus]|uniref:Aminoglycoside phosphotransferase domain-containing protein n=1 Tax=Serinibacter arcticus TaxID=1655435 RepID=A0A2U1ZX15_9MICO|nr:hypothetical protein [Serinibacter arcticus]PWD51529.1 hypothetical protein C8046_13555 [Serinibacter arcticus]